MPKRPRSHQLEDISRSHLHRRFEEAGWTVEDLAKDYGEDLLVRIFENGKSTPLSFFVQAKATENINRCLSRNAQTINYPVSVEHLKHWRTLHEPVILTLWDCQSDSIYWTCIQNVLAPRNTHDLKSRITVRVPIRTSDVLSPIGLGRIQEIAEKRYGRLEPEADAAKAFIELLETKLDCKIEYSPHGVATIIKPRQGGEAIFFGKILEQLQEFCNVSDLPPQEVFDRALEWFVKEIRTYYRTGKFPVRDKETGKIELRRMSRKQFRAHILEETLEP